jgi:glycosyltransferase involved in cell wall biosynthesis
VEGSIANRSVQADTRHDASTRLRVLVATPNGLGGQGGIDRMNDMAIDAITAAPALNVTVERLVTRGHGNILQSPVVLARALLQLRRAARRREVDVLHICLSLKGSAYRKILLAALARYYGVPYVMHVHGGGFEFFWLTANAWLRRAMDRALAQSAKVVLLGRYWVGIFRGWLPQTDGKLVVLPNATPASTIENEPAADGRVRLTFLGELGRRKGTPQLMLALANLADRDDWTATIAGNGDVEETRAWAGRLGLTERIRIPGWLGPEATAELMRRSDVVVLPTFIENLPMIIPEAFACGIPVITTPVAAITEAVVHERNGLLVPPGDIEALTDAMRRLIDAPELRQRLGRAAREDHAGSFDIRGYAERLVKLWREVAS